MNDDPMRQAEQNLILARERLISAAEACCELAGTGPTDRLLVTGLGVVAALDQLRAACASGDLHAIETCSRSLSEAVVVGVNDLIEGCAGEGAVAFLGAVVLLRAELVGLDAAVSDVRVLEGLDEWRRGDDDD